MTFSSVLRSVADGYDHGRLSGHALPQRIFAGTALGFVALSCAWVLWANLAGNAVNQAIINEPSPVRVAQKAAKLPSLANAYAKLAAAMHGYAGQAALGRDYAALFDPRSLLGTAAGTFSTKLGLQADASGGIAGYGRFTVKVAREIASTLKNTDRLVEKVAAAALPARSPQARLASLPATPGAPAEKPTIFERLFGKSSPFTLAYASADDGDLGDGYGATAGRYDRWTAVYDISAHTVYLPDGTSLEAHSGRGDRIDDPNHVDERNRGSTPPDVYDLQLRDGLFHGVQAIRLIPADERKVFGRSGFLAHTYMLGPNGDSFGCVSFKNYNAFLQAYLNHKIKRLAVIAGPV